MNQSNPTISAEGLASVAAEGLAQLASGEPASAWPVELVEVFADQGPWAPMAAAIALRTIGERGSGESLPDAARSIVADAVRQRSRKEAAQ